MLNVLLPGNEVGYPPAHTDAREVVVCIYGSDIERFYDDDGNETEMVVTTDGCLKRKYALGKVLS